MTDALDDFLQADELNEAARLAQSLKLDERDTARVRAIITTWEDPQPVVNLLRYPLLMPEDVRREALLRGLQAPQTYATLAAIVGLQGGVAWWSEPDRAVIVARLLTLIFEGTPVIADRASVTLSEYARREDAERLLFFVGYPGKVVAHNALITLVRLLGAQETQQRIQDAYANGRVSQAALDYCAKHLAAAQDGSLLLTYIPNLKDSSASVRRSGL